MKLFAINLKIKLIFKCKLLHLSESGKAGEQ